MKITFLEEAEAEFANAVSYYDSQELGLGQRFEEELDRALTWLARHPQAVRLRRRKYRRLNLHVFPYYIAYVARAETLWVVAVGHAARRPEYWINRLSRIG